MCVCACVCVCVCVSFSCVLVPLWTVTCQAPLSKGFPRQEYWRGLPFPPPGDLPNPGIKPVSSESPVLAGGFFTTEKKSSCQIEDANNCKLNKYTPEW